MEKNPRPASDIQDDSSMNSDVAGFMGGAGNKNPKKFSAKSKLNEGNPPDPNDKKNKKTVGFK